VPLTVLRYSDRHVREIYDADLILVRPDQHVAWRGNATGDAPAADSIVVRAIAG
jgi:hypothetical protein